MGSYVRTKIKSIVDVTDIVTIHYYEFDKNFMFRGEKHDFWEMVYVDNGQVEITRDGESLLLNQEEIIFHKPNEFHSIKSSQSSPNIFVISFVCKSDAMCYFDKLKVVLDQPLKLYIASILNEAKNAYVIPKNDPSLKKLTLKPEAWIGSEQLIKIYLEQLLIFLIRKQSHKKLAMTFPLTSSEDHPLIQSMKQYLQERINDKLSIGEISAHFNYGKTYLSTLFKEKTGMSIMAYVTFCKIEKAKQMIRSGLYNISEISEILSFDNPQYFSQVFKRVTGITPTEFRKTLIK